MIRYKVHLDNPHNRSIQKAVEALENSELIIYPTDTVYGIGCSINEKQAIEKIYWLKGKSKFEPMSIICASIQQASIYAKISNFSYKILRRCFPGSFTVVLEATREIPKLMLSRRKEIGIRIPDNKVTTEIVNGFGPAILNTSVNLYHEQIINDPDVIFEEFDGKVQVMLDGGILPDAEESTVIRLVDNTVEVIREGKGNLQNLYI
jgi:tRNA threonylcarbamoyl adenosine modification protein (Sua5/YciO/YrdC/YwlC family)